MIQLTRLNHEGMVLNSDLIEHIDVTPDTMITLTTGAKIMVLESVEQVVERVVRFRRSICQGLCASSGCGSAREPAEPPEQLGRSVDEP
jgi:flagellar protein FlbD